MSSFHRFGRDTIVEAFRAETGRNPTDRERQWAQQVALGESSYGKGWKGEGKGSNNWGAVQCGRPPCRPDCFPYQDSNKDGKYDACFRAYESPVAGARHFLRVLYFGNNAKRGGTLKAVNSGSVQAASAAMYKAGYYESNEATPAAAVAWHVKGSKRRLATIQSALKEPDAFAGGGKSGGLLLVAAAGVGLLALSRAIR